MTMIQPPPDQEITARTPHTCPFLGIPGDATTHYQYPSRQNYCHVPDHPEPIQADHQGSFCLTAQHIHCPVYRQEGAVSLPPELRGENGGSVPSTLQKWAGLLFTFFGLAAMIVLFGYLVLPWLNRSPASLLSINPLQPTETKPSPAEKTGTMPTLIPAQIFLSTPLLVTPTQTPTPLLTPTPTPITPSATPTYFPTPGPGLGTPFGTIPKFVIHVVQAGESFTSISAKYGTTIESLQAINILVEGQSLWEGRQIVVPLGVIDPEGLPKFSVYLVPENTTLSQLAALFNSDPEQIRSANGLGPQPEIPAGRWLIIPVNE